ncbi:MAG: LysR family transcriptional regulator [Pseudomonadota bacterium]
MNLTELRTFLAIVENGSLARASAQLNVTQSTVTARLQSLEAELGQRLLNRQKSGVTLTGPGERFRKYADTISDLWRQARQETALPGPTEAVCNIGSHPDLWPGLGAMVFTDLQDTQPNLALSAWHGGQHDLAYWLATGLIDLALTYWPVETKGCDTLELPMDKLVLVSSEPNAPARNDPGYVLAEHGQAFTREHAAAYSDAGTARISFGSSELALSHVLTQGGSAYLPARLVAQHLATGQLHRVPKAPTFERQPYLLVRRSAQKDWPWYTGVLQRLMD